MSEKTERAETPVRFKLSKEAVAILEAMGPDDLAWMLRAKISQNLEDAGNKASELSGLKMAEFRGHLGSSMKGAARDEALRRLEDMDGGIIEVDDLIEGAAMAGAVLDTL